MLRRTLTVLDEKSFARRPFMLGTVSACLLNACGSVVQEGEGGVDGSADADDGADASMGTDAGRTDVSRIDAGADAARDGDVDAISDTGTDARRDVGTDVAHDSGPTCTPGVTRLGTVTTFALNTWHLLTSLRVIVAHDAGGLYAYSAVCTHSGCVVDPPSSTGVAYCACHGSRFNGNGAVLTGPAGTPLVHYQVTICAGIAYVNRARTVTAATRTPIP